MYRSESAFKKALLGALRKQSLMCTCIETGRTSQGVPDVYVMGWGEHVDTWLELKNMPEASITKEKWKIPWRPGQQAWAYEYYMRHECGLCTLTVCALSDGFLVIPMNGMYKDNVVEKSHTYCATASLQEVVSRIVKRVTF